MPDETQKPKRKRWRWIIAGVLLFVGSAAGWWYWPRGDARFVGKWDSGAGTVTYMTANGFASFNMIVGGKPYRQPSRWFVKGNEFYFDTWGPKWNAQLDHLIKTLAGRETPTKFEIVSAERDELQLKQPDGHIQVWTRLPNDR